MAAVAVVSVQAELALELAMALACAGVTQMTGHAKLLMHQHLQDQIGKLRQGCGARSFPTVLALLRSEHEC